MERNRFFCHFGPFFALLPTTTQTTQNQNFEKMKIKTWRSIYISVPKIIICSDIPEIGMARDKFLFFVHFGLVSTLLRSNNQDLKNAMIHLEISLFYKMFIKNYDRMIYDS